MKRWICTWLSLIARRNSVADRVHSHWGSGRQWWGLWVSLQQIKFNPVVFVALRQNLPLSELWTFSLQTMRQVKASVIWSSKLWWSLRTVSPSPSSSLLRLAKKRQHGPATSARWGHPLKAAGSESFCVVISADPMTSFWCFSAVCFSASITSDVTAWWPACLRRTPKFLCRTWSSKRGRILRRV